jgi:hypothetical protein
MPALALIAEPATMTAARSALKSFFIFWPPKDRDNNYNYNNIIVQVQFTAKNVFCQGNGANISAAGEI